MVEKVAHLTCVPTQPSADVVVLADKDNELGNGAYGTVRTAASSQAEAATSSQAEAAASDLAQGAGVGAGVGRAGRPSCLWALLCLHVMLGFGVYLWNG